MDGVGLRKSPFPPFSESAGVSESLRSPFRGEELSGGGFPEGPFPGTGEAVAADNPDVRPFETNAVATLMRGFQPQPRPTPRKRGRPRKRSAAFFGEVMRGHRSIAAWFEAEHGRQANSDVELIESFRAYIVNLAPTESREANVLSIGCSLKTVQNVLGEARRFFKEHPEKSPFFGVDETSGEP